LNLGKAGTLDLLVVELTYTNALQEIGNLYE